MNKYFLLFVVLITSIFAIGQATLYVYRPLLNGDDLRQWAEAQGLHGLPHNMHVTLAYSPGGVKKWSVVKDVKPNVLYNSDPKHLRQFDLFGTSRSILVLKLNVPELTKRWKELIAAGATWDHPTYEPHITLSYSGYNYDIKKLTPYYGELIFGPEIYEFR